MNLKTAQMIIRLLDDWELNPKEIIGLLELEGVSSRHLDHYRSGAETFPENEQLDQKIDHIAGIANALATTFPKNENMARVWLNTPHRRLSNQTPLEKMLSDGLNGLVWVRSELDCSFAWQRNQGSGTSGNA